MEKVNALVELLVCLTCLPSTNESSNLLFLGNSSHTNFRGFQCVYTVVGFMHSSPLPCLLQIMPVCRDLRILIVISRINNTKLYLRQLIRCQLVGGAWERG